MNKLRGILAIGCVIAMLGLSGSLLPVWSAVPKKRQYRSDQSVRPGDVLRLELLSPVGTKDSREGDQFTARVLSPTALQDTFIEGHVVRINRSGRVSGRAEVELSFDTLVMTDKREQQISAEVESVERNEVEVDAEGRVKSRGSQTRDAILIAGGAGIGTAIGAIIGGKKGAAIGSAIGAAAGTTTVLTTRGEDLDFPTGTTMQIRITQ